MTKLAAIMAEQKLTYTAVATRAQLQPRTVRQIATGETPIDNVAVGTVRRIASVLGVPLIELIEPGVPWPGDSTLPRGARLSAAVRELMWGGSAQVYASPVESTEPDDITDMTPEAFFAGMPLTDARRA